MIGLGSNRLTVCRRGGMSVTQAGKGGMEWLAGGRMPSWASPYSAQATAALLAQFPTQWQTIRDYGFAHPALVPFINEDPMLVMSLIEGLGTRWLISQGGAYALWEKENNIPILSTDKLDALVKMTEAGIRFQFMHGNWDTHGIWMGWDSNSGARMKSVWLGNCQNQNTYSVSFSLNTEYRYLAQGKISSINGTSWNNEDGANFDETKIYLCHSGSGDKAWTKYINIKDSQDNPKWIFVPCKHKVNGVLKAGILDINNVIWRGNDATSNGQELGSFTISETSPS